MTQNFGRVLISSVWKQQDNLDKGILKLRVPVKTEEEYMKAYKKYNKSEGGLAEIVGLEEYQVKPYFDLDPKGEFNYSIIDDFIGDLKKICDVDYYIGGREAREDKGIIKHSRRIYLKARITYSNIPIIFKEVFDKYNDVIDKSVYTPSRCLYAPLSDRKKNNIVPEMKILKGSLFDCCASYILEDYDNLDLKISTKKNDVDKFFDRINDEDIKDEDNENDNDKYLKIQKLIKLLSESRSSNFDSWIKLNWCIINICKKENINQTKMNRLIHQFSKLSKSNYDEDKVDDWIEKNIDKVKETGYGWNYLYQNCIKEDAPAFYEKLTQSYYNVKKEFENNHLKIIHPPFIIYVDENKDNIIQAIPLCEKSYRHIQAFIKEKNNNGEDVYKKKRFIERWLDDPQIRKYNKMVFKPPPLNVEPYDYNTWTDFEIIKTSYISNDKIIERFLEYTNNLFNNVEIVNYILAYFANRLQNPANRNNVCIILYGEEGDGKNRFFDIFKNIVGKKYFTELESGKQLFNTHSCIEKEKLFICVNEARGKDNYENADILKSRITTETLMVNPKGIQEFEIQNYCDYIMTTNNHNAVNIQDKSRRFLLVETSSYYSRNSEFFNSFSDDIVDNKKALRVIYEYLMKYDVKSVIPSGNFQSHIPITEIQQTIIRDNRDKIELFLRDLVENDEYTNNNEIDDVKMKNSALFAMWCNWIETNKIKNEYNSVSFGTRFGILIKKKKITEYIRRDTNSNTFINFGKLKNYFDNNP
jgi:hypothetical protein